ncbi:MAG TPA: gephyrin-like molybdotransferase Glp [Tepidisphaeraceae bacterium]|nr:gephyrin-like molybdotransferase Glp [Tepidisphaeraceae bacterium]
MNLLTTSILTFEQALATVLEHARDVPTPTIEPSPLLQSAGRVLAEPILADRDQPPFDRATRDGFAVHAHEWSSGETLRVIGQVRAGEIWRRTELPTEAAIEIMTGAPVPPGADAVAMVEHAVLERDWVRAAEGRRLIPGENIVDRGSEARAGDTVVPAATLITAAEIAMSATCGLSHLQVYRRPAVAIIATGDELVELNERPAPHQIRNSNGYALSALVHFAGGDPHLLPIARDTHEDLRARIGGSAVLGADLVLLSGGVSAGKYDFVEEVLAEHKAEFLFTGVRMQPGKPVVFGRMPAARLGDSSVQFRYFFGLPGNPISTEVTFHCFVAPMIRALSGAGICVPRFVQATITEGVPAKPGLTRLLPGCLAPDLHSPTVRLVPWHGSGDLAANTRANCYAVLPDSHEPHAGEVITVLLR